MKTLTVVRKEYLERVRSKSFLIGTLLGPALMSMFIVLPVLLSESGGEQQRTIGVIDPSGQYLEPLREALIAQKDEHLTLLPISVATRPLQESVNELKNMILSEAVYGGLVIDPAFATTRQVTFYNTSVSALVLRDEHLRPALDRVLRGARFRGEGVAESLYTYLTQPVEINSVAVTPEGKEAQQNETSVFVVSVVLILILYIMVIMYGSHTLTAVIEEKNSRIVEVLLSSLKPGQLMLGKVLGIGLAGLTQFGVWAGAFFVLSLQGVTMGQFTLDASLFTPLILASFVIFFLLGFFLYATIYAGVGAMCNSVQDSQQFHTPIVMGLVLPMMMLSFVLRSPDSTLAVVLSLVPLFSPVLMFMRICLQTPPLWQIGLSWLLLLLAIWLVARAAGKLFRLGILMYGASPTWASLARAIKSS